MSHNTEIEWTHIPGYRGETWNPWTGCTKVSPGCAHCYIEDTPPFRMAGIRFEQGKIPITIYPDRLHMPLRWKKPRAIFVNSMSDLFHEDVPRAQLDAVFGVMAMAPQHIFMVLTKRSERMRAYFEEGKPWERVANRCREINRYAIRGGHVARREAWPLPNAWLGVTVENRRKVGRADLLRQTPAAVRFISAEPLLGPLVYDGIYKHRAVGNLATPPERCWADGFDGPQLDLTDIDWIITGGESGARHRPFDEQHALDIHDAATAAGVAFFHKQNGGRTPKAGGRELARRTYDEFPDVGNFLTTAA